ncbi:Protein turtle like B [Dissostichus eleginoides]|uniref:Protein turtle like B n=1 Tax=Dissostichus eleginoides TaxID=100907 RepID=A0AAD9BYU9_DISEL|nr:Protein turtle like B [Dissostichus eleginoides]
MKDTSLLLLLSSLFCCSTNAAARLTVTPSSSQVFRNERVSLRCEDASDGWTVRRNTSMRKELSVRTGEDLLVPPVTSAPWTLWTVEFTGVSPQRDPPVTPSPSPSLLLITFILHLALCSDRSVFLQSPLLPVMEGDNVTLTCTTKMADPPPADFYKDGISIRNVSDGHMTLLHVSRSDEGLYKCRVQGNESAESRLSVSEKPTTTARPSNSTAGVEMGEDVTYSDVKISQSRKKPIKQSRGSRESDPASIYSEVKKKRDVCYGEITINTNRRREIVPEPDVLYSSLK